MAPLRLPVTALLLSGMALAAPCYGDEACAADLGSIPSFLLENDPGIRDAGVRQGRDSITTLAKGFVEDALLGTNDAQCLDTLKKFLKTLREGHLGIVATKDNAALAAQRDSPGGNTWQPSLRELSPSTLLLTLPSFAVGYRKALDALLREHTPSLLAHPNWIIDVRNNGGGSDGTWSPLVPWLVPNERVEVSSAWFATESNARGLDELCANYLPSDDPNCRTTIPQLADRLRRAVAGTLVPVTEDKPGGYTYRQPQRGPATPPKKVAILIDRQCASSCEQFLLTARQGYAVKLLGRRTFGALDYSNLLPHNLPSGKRVLWYAASRSQRLPHLPVDPTGVIPDIPLPPPHDEADREGETERVKQWLEGGSLNPARPSP